MQLFGVLRPEMVLSQEHVLEKLREAPPAETPANP
jgi:hypothetical protein